MNKRMDTLQALRFLACLCIFAHHCYIIEYVYWGVSVFFVLSGFLMAYNYYGRPALSLSPLASLRFSIGKVGKLYPLHVLALLPVLALNIYFRESNGTDWAGIVTSVVYNLAHTGLVTGLRSIVERCGVVSVRMPVFILHVPVCSLLHTLIPFAQNRLCRCYRAILR